MCMQGHALFKTVFGKCQGTNLFVISMRLIVLLMNLAPTYLMNCELNEWIQDKTDVFLAK
jgi:hypothetical protein